MVMPMKSIISISAIGMMKSLASHLCLIAHVFALFATSSVVRACPSGCRCDNTRVYCDNIPLNIIPSNIPPDATYLSLAHNNIVQISAGQLNLTSLRILHLNNNNISIIEPDAFARLESLQNLQLRQNAISVLRSGTFNNLWALTKLLIDHNRLREIPGEIFKDLGNLKSLHLNDNELTLIPNDTFNAMTKLTTLDISRNPLHEFPSRFPASIETFDANGLGTKEQRNSTIHFDGGYLLNVVSLSLDNNNLRELPSGFRNLRRLQFVSLPHNLLETIVADQVSHLTDIVFLDLTGNLLEEIPSHALQHMPHLEILSLGLNSIHNIKSDAFVVLTNLTTLLLGHNNITGIDVDAFNGLLALSTLDLRNNSLKTLPQGIFGSLAAQIDLRLSGNPWHCDCNLRWLRDSLVTYPNIMEPMCMTPSKHANQRISSVARMDLACPPVIEPTGSYRIHVEPGMRVEMQCRIISGEPHPNIIWTNDDAMNSGEYHIKISYVFHENGSLIIAKAKQSDQGSYTCIVENSAGRAVVYYQLIINHVNVRSLYKIVIPVVIVVVLLIGFVFLVMVAKIIKKSRRANEDNNNDDNYDYLPFAAKNDSHLSGISGVEDSNIYETNITQSTSYSQTPNTNKTSDNRHVSGANLEDSFDREDNQHDASPSSTNQSDDIPYPIQCTPDLGINENEIHDKREKEQPSSDPSSVDEVHLND